MVESRGPALLGRDWLSKIRLDWAAIRSEAYAEKQQALEALLNKYGQAFKPGLGTLTQFEAHLTFKRGTTPVFHRLHSVPFTIHEKLGKELDRLEENGVLRREDYSEWAAPVVPMPKSLQGLQRYSKSPPADRPVSTSQAC